MTPIELEEVLRSINLQSLSDKELSLFYDVLDKKNTEIKRVSNCRKHLTTHFPLIDKKSN